MSGHTELDFTSADGVTPLGINLFHPGGTVTATIVFAHGGGFSHGSRRTKNAALLADALKGDGIAVASIDYRKKTPLEAFDTDRQGEIARSQDRVAQVGLKINRNYCGPMFYAAVEDFAAALGFLRVNAVELGLSGPFVAFGESAGGMAALSLAYPPGRGWENMPKPDAAVGVSAAFCQPWRLSAGGVPALMIHSHHDGVVSPHNARFIARKARKRDAALEVIIDDEVRGHRAMVDAVLTGNDATGRPYLDRLRGLIDRVSASATRKVA